MKSFKIEFSLALIPGLAIITSAVLGAILILSLFSSINIANSQSFRLSSPSPSPSQFQSQSQQSQQSLRQQKPLNTDGISITRNINEQQMFHQPFAISLQSSQVWSPLSQQRQNQPPHQEQQQKYPNTDGINDSNKPDNDLSSMATLLPPPKIPQPLCHFNMDPLFCPHYLWVLK